MPEISRFFGIIVYMYWRDHEPAHFHVDYSGQKAEISIDPVGLLKGKLSPKALALVRMGCHASAGVVGRLGTSQEQAAAAKY